MAQKIIKTVQYCAMGYNSEKRPRLSTSKTCVHACVREIQGEIEDGERGGGDGGEGNEWREGEREGQREKVEGGWEG